YSDVGGGGLRTIVIAKSGNSSSPASRSVASQMTRFGAARDKVRVADTEVPSAAVPLNLQTQESSTGVHLVSAKPPASSKVQDRICLACGSQPMRCVPLRTTWPSWTI